jgi:hypothetical protein
MNPKIVRERMSPEELDQAIQHLLTLLHLVRKCRNHLNRWDVLDYDNAFIFLRNKVDLKDLPYPTTIYGGHNIFDTQHELRPVKSSKLGVRKQPRDAHRVSCNSVITGGSGSSCDVRSEAGRLAAAGGQADPPPTSRHRRDV